MEANELRDYIAECLRKIGVTAIITKDGTRHSSADIGIEIGKGNIEEYKVTVMKYRRRKT